MKLYKITVISAALTFISGIVALILNPKPQRDVPMQDPTLAGDISLIVMGVMSAIFLVLLAISYAHHKLADREMRCDTERTSKFQIFTTAGKYDEKYDSALSDKKEEHEKHKFD